MMKNHLAAIESYFQAYLLNKDPLSIQTFVTEDEQIRYTERLKIYYDAYRLRLIEILQADYPKLHQLMEQKNFTKLAEDYITAYPSPYFSVRYFGQYLSQFLKEREAPLHLIEMAEFEWKLNDILDAADSSIVNSEVLYALPPEHWGELRLEFHPSIQIIECRWNVPQIWQSLDLEEMPPDLYQLEMPITWLLWRKELGSYYRSLSKAEMICIQQFQNNQNFSEVCEILCDSFPEEEVPKEALSFIQRSISDGIIANIL